MPRRLTEGTDELVFHVMNRAARRLRLFQSGDDYEAFLSCLKEAQQKVPVRLLAYCLMPNHFHLVLWPEKGLNLGRFMKRLTGTDAKRWHKHRGTVGTGCVYQARIPRHPCANGLAFPNRLPLCGAQPCPSLSRRPRRRLAMVHSGQGSQKLPWGPAERVASSATRRLGGGAEDARAGSGCDAAPGGGGHQSAVRRARVVSDRPGGDPAAGPSPGRETASLKKTTGVISMK